jgi:hypothetical protein
MLTPCERTHAANALTAATKAAGNFLLMVVLEACGEVSCVVPVLPLPPPGGDAAPVAGWGAVVPPLTPPDFAPDTPVTVAAVRVTADCPLAAAWLAVEECEDPPQALTATHDTRSASGSAAAFLARPGLSDWWMGVCTDLLLLVNRSHGE